MTFTTEGSPGFRAGKSPAFFVLGTATPESFPYEEVRVGQLEGEDRQRQIEFTGRKRLDRSSRDCQGRGKLIRSGGMPVASTPAPISWASTWDTANSTHFP